MGVGSPTRADDDDRMHQISDIVFVSARAASSVIGGRGVALTVSHCHVLIRPTASAGYRRFVLSIIYPSSLRAQVVFVSAIGRVPFVQVPLGSLSVGYEPPSSEVTRWHMMVLWRSVQLARECLCEPERDLQYSGYRFAATLSMG